MTRIYPQHRAKLEFKRISRLFSTRNVPSAFVRELRCLKKKKKKKRKYGCRRDVPRENNHQSRSHTRRYRIYTFPRRSLADSLGGYTKAKTTRRLLTRQLDIISKSTDRRGAARRKTRRPLRKRRSHESVLRRPVQAHAGLREIVRTRQKIVGPSCFYCAPAVSECDAVLLRISPRGFSLDFHCPARSWMIAISGPLERA